MIRKGAGEEIIKGLFLTYQNATDHIDWHGLLPPSPPPHNQILERVVEAILDSPIHSLPDHCRGQPSVQPTNPLLSGYCVQAVCSAKVLGGLACRPLQLQDGLGCVQGEGADLCHHCCSTTIDIRSYIQVR